MFLTLSKLFANFDSKCFITQEICNTTVNRCFFYLILFLIKVVSGDPFLLVYCPDQYETQKMFDKAVDDSLAALKLIPD